MLSSCFGIEPTLVVITKAKTATRTLTIEPDTVTFPSVTETPTPTRTKAITPTSTLKSTSTTRPTNTATVTPSFTLEPATITLKQDTACFVGTSFVSNIITYVVANSNYPVLATIEDQSWWFVSLEETKECWIFGEYASIQGASSELPVITPSPPPSPTATVPLTTYGIYYILIAKDTGGPFGCGDSLIQYYPGVWVNGDMEDDIVAALNALFSNHSEYVGDLYNPIYQSQLKAKGVEIVGGDVVVTLGGSLVRPKDDCESKRMRAQIWYTISQFTSTRPVVYLNNALLGDLLVVTNK